MIYRDFQDLKLSALGFGTMRMPLAGEDYTQVDIRQVEEMVEHAISHGVNYFDTAWGYHGGNSERVIGQVLRQYPRESYYLATKFPGFDKTNMSRVREIFEEQLQKCQVEYFDFYLFHNVCERNIDDYLDPQYGIFDYLMEQKKLGRIRHLGFSAHGSVAVIRRFLEKYGHGIEFGQLQLNWLDWEFQNAREKYDLLQSYGIPVWIMEPLRGGKLCSLSPEHEAVLKDLRPQESIPGWAFRFLQSLPAVTMILSGMSNLEQMVQNTKTFETEEPLKPREMDAILSIGSQMIAASKLPCTSCRYCTAHCPRQLDIPSLMELYNARTFGEGSAVETEPGRGPEDCIGCRSCEELCPQGIKISEVMERLRFS